MLICGAKLMTSCETAKSCRAFFVKNMLYDGSNKIRCSETLYYESV
ncbi:hypothetical protein GCWU000325_01018 [Alloprevotella tannerae ATCC 51259]|uniref:Uncharacterized protein n=1 Tax=Alloprevotella tannerae ATCC 51259 TaxID=626522 RepID=C9LFN0_9BACT|nr:hypothetical protein GCWU000325_01018 [Alloprevotella tannerae ATCC 51259]